MFAIIAMTTFILIAILGFFHVISAQATEWGFAIWFFALVIRSQIGPELWEPLAEPDLENAFPLGKSHVVKPKHVSPPQGGDATIPVEREDYSHPTIRLMKLIEREIYMRNTIVNSSDVSYDEPQATYPEMTMKQKG